MIFMNWSSKVSLPIKISNVNSFDFRSDLLNCEFFCFFLVFSFEEGFSRIFRSGDRVLISLLKSLLNIQSQRLVVADSATARSIISSQIISTRDTAFQTIERIIFTQNWLIFSHFYFTINHGNYFRNNPNTYPK